MRIGYGGTRTHICPPMSTQRVIWRRHNAFQNLEAQVLEKGGTVPPIIKGHTTSKLSYGEGRQRGIYPPMNPPKGTRASVNEDWCRVHKTSQNFGAKIPQ